MLTYYLLLEQPLEKRKRRLPVLTLLHENLLRLLSFVHWSTKLINDQFERLNNLLKEADILSGTGMVMFPKLVKATQRP